jgi:hypothetical protein
MASFSTFWAADGRRASPLAFSCVIPPVVAMFRADMPVWIGTSYWSLLQIRPQRAPVRRPYHAGNDYWRVTGKEQLLADAHNDFVGARKI